MNNVKTPFFLTGGTALSRYYTHHRYSDDLDFFVVQRSDYSRLVDSILSRFITAESHGDLRVDRSTISKSEAHTRLYVALVA